MLTLLLLLAAVDTVRPVGAWARLFEEQGVAVYQDEGAPRAFKAEGTLEAELLELLAVLADIPRRPEWVASLVATRIVRGDPESHVVLHSRFDLPWPASDRDSVIESVITKHPERALVRVEFRVVRDPLVPPVDGVVRVPMADGGFELQAVSAGRTRVAYWLRLDQGGALPGWLVERFVREAPRKTLEALDGQVKKTRGEYAAFIERHGP